MNTTGQKRYLTPYGKKWREAMMRLRKTKIIDMFRANRLTMNTSWDAGYYCAVAAILRLEGAVTPQIRSLFHSGGNPENAEPSNQMLFAEMGLKILPKPEWTSASIGCGTAK